MSSPFDNAEALYLERLKSGEDVRGALDAAQSVVHDARVVEAATEMLVAEGAIDMKRLAAAAGMSRASLYRYYPDRHQVEGEIAAIGLSAMIDVAAAQPTPSAKMRAIAGYVRDHPAQGVALGHMATDASVDALATTAELLIGDRTAAPTLVGLVSMIASGVRGGGEDELEGIIDAVADRLTPCGG